MKNRHKLDRNIPEEIKRQVRQRCGFGCVICGYAIYEYEHFSPEFAQAKIHGPDGITLLCPLHHALKTRGLLSLELIIKHNKSPKACEQGFSRGPFDIGNEHPIIVLGGVTFERNQILLRVYGDEILSIQPPFEMGQPFLLSAFLTNDKNEVILEVVNNEWKTSTDNWDCTVIGNVITIRSRLNNIELVLRSTQPHSIIIERLKMQHRGIFIACEGERLKIDTGKGIINAINVTIQARVGIDIDEQGYRLGGN